MRNKKRLHGLNGYQEVYSVHPEHGGKTYLKITRHMPHKGKTYFLYHFANPRDKRHPQEPDVYRYFFRILWNKEEPLLQEKVIHTDKWRQDYWEESDKQSSFNLFPNYNEMVEKIKSIIVEHELLYCSTDPKVSHNTGGSDGEAVQNE